MNINSTVPELILYLNYIILLINIFNIARIARHINRDDENRPYFLILLLSATSLLTVNIFSAITHYIVYFQHKELLIPADATWTKFTDRYAMLCKSIFNCLMTSPYVLVWMSKFYIRRKTDIKQ